MTKRVATFVLCLLAVSAGILAGTARFVFAELDISPIYKNNEEINDLLDSIEDKKSKIESLEAAAKEYENRINEQRSHANTLQSQLGILDNLITKVELDVKTTQAKMDKTKLEIESTNLQIDQQEKELEVQKDRILEFIRLIYKNDQRTLLENLILNDSLSEFFTQINYTEELQSDLKQSVDRLKILHDSLEVQRAELERQQSDLENLKGDLERQQDSLEQDKGQKESLLTQTRNNEQLYQKLLVETKQIQNEIDSDILHIEDQVKQKIERLRRTGTSPTTTLIDWPIPGRYITTYFHDPEYPYRNIFEHNAIDIRSPQGTPIAAPADGYVSQARNNGYGYSYIILIHDNGISTVYGHVSRIYVKSDTFVKQGEVIGLTGATPGTLGAGPFTTGPHLHFEVRLNGVPVNPLEYLP